MVDSERTFKIKIRLGWTICDILPTSAIICILKVLHKNEIVQYLHEFDQGHSRKLL